MAKNICTPRPDDALPRFCEIMDCDELATYDCYPAVAPGVTSLQATIALCGEHAREADPGLVTVRQRPTIVCLCGSTRFSQAFHEANLKETLAGKIVLSIGCDFKSDADLLLAGELTPGDKERLDELHLRKIDLADEILALNVGGYVGQSTSREIQHARAKGKTVRFLESEAGNG